MEGNQNRLAEIALELFGAKAASEFLKQAWGMADPEAKRKIADEMLAAASNALKADSSWSRAAWDARSMFDAAVKRVVDERLKEEQPVIEAQILEYANGPLFKAVLETAVKVAAEKVAARLVARLSNTVVEKLLEKERGY